MVQTEVDGNGRVVDRLIDGRLERRNAADNGWDIISGNFGTTPVVQTEVDGNGRIVDRLSDGRLERRNAADNGWDIISAGVVQTEVDGNGRIVDRLNDGRLERRNAADNGWDIISAGAKTTVVDGSGRIVDLLADGRVERRNAADNGWDIISVGATTTVVDGTGRVVDLLNDGRVERRNTADNGWEIIRFAATSLDIAPDGTLLIVDWFQSHFRDPVLQKMARAYLLDGTIDRNDVLNIFKEVERDGNVQDLELSDMQALAAGAAFVSMSGPVQNLMIKVVNGNPANGHYQGQVLGDLHAGSSSTQLQQLVNKWFLGMDHPAVSHDGDLSNYQTVPDLVFQTTSAGGASLTITMPPTLFNLQTGVPSYGNAWQGGLGDCVLIASLAEVAAQSPQTIKSMFIDNGDNTWTVRFYQNGMPDYVTVDLQLPYGGWLFDHPTGGNPPSSGTLFGLPYSTPAVPSIVWVALAEKAYAQMNEEGWLPTNQPGVNAYAPLDGADQWQAAGILNAVSGRSSHASDNNVNADSVAYLFSRGEFVVLGTTVGSNVLVPTHEYAVVGYDPKSATFTLFNPWGIGGGDYSNHSYPGLVQISKASLSLFINSSWTGTSNGRLPVETPDQGRLPGVPQAISPGDLGSLSAAALVLSSATVDAAPNTVLASEQNILSQPAVTSATSHALKEYSAFLQYAVEMRETALVGNTAERATLNLPSSGGLGQPMTIENDFGSFGNDQLLGNVVPTNNQHGIKGHDNSHLDRLFTELGSNTLSADALDFWAHL